MWRKSTVTQQRHGREEDGVIKRQRRETQGRGQEKDNKGGRERKNTDYFVIYLWLQKNVMGSVGDSFLLSVSWFISQNNWTDWTWHCVQLFIVPGGQFCKNVWIAVIWFVNPGSKWSQWWYLILLWPQECGTTIYSIQDLSHKHAFLMFVYFSCTEANISHQAS